MNVKLRPRDMQDRPARAAQTVIDCDIHPAQKSPADLHPFLEARWREHLQQYGMRARRGFEAGTQYPKGQRNAARRDAWPPVGGRPGSDLPFMVEQLLDPNNIAFGILNPVGDNGQPSQNQEFGAAYCRAVNDWQVAAWTSQEPRLRASIVVPYENTPAAVAEIHRRAGDPAFVQVILQSRSGEPFGRKRYLPIFEAAAEAGLPVAVHAFGVGGHPITSGGWPSYYIEDMVSHAQACQALLSSMIVEGVFEHCPDLRFVLVESAFGWLPSLGWRLDRTWKRLKSETPHLRRAPSEILREQVWVTSQPIEEPEKPAHLIDVIEWIGWDRIMFATDYPHWDFDDPARALPAGISPENRARFFHDNAAQLYGLG